MTPGRFFFIWIGVTKASSAPGFHEPGHRVADDLAGQVVEVGLEHPDAVAGGGQLDGADEEAEDVGLVGHFAGPGSQADRLDGQGGEGSEPFDDGGEDGGAGGGGHLALDHRLGQRDASEQFGRRRCGQWHPAVSGLDPAAAGRHRAGLEPVHAQQVEADRGADDVDDRVDRADFVEVDLGEVDAVNVRLGLAELQEDPLGQIFLAGRQDALVDDRFDVMQWRWACSCGVMTLA